MMKSAKLVILIVLSLLLLGCGQQSKEQDQSKQNVSGSANKISVFVSYGGFEKIFAEFKKDSGIEVEYLEMSSGEVLAKIRAEKGKPIGDVWFGGGIDSFIAAQNDGLLLSYVSPEAQYIQEKYRDKNGYWTGVSLATVTFVANSKLMQDKGWAMPKVWEDLAKPEYKGELLFADPTVAGTSYTMIAGLLQLYGQEKGWKIIEGMARNAPFLAKRGGEPPLKVAMGEAIIAVAPDTADDLKAKGYPLEVIFPQDGTPIWPSPVAIFKGAKNEAGAKTFVDWLLSKKGQETVLKYCPRPPVREDVALPESLQGIKNVKLMDIDFIAAGRERDEILKEWKRRCVQ